MTDNLNTTRKENVYADQADVQSLKTKGHPLYRSYAWYFDQYINGDQIGPIYKIEHDQTIYEFHATSKVLGTATLDIQVSDTPTGNWQSLFSAKPAFNGSSYISTTGVFSSFNLTSGNYISSSISANFGCEGVTMQVLGGY